jgi:hypothetical protein
VQYDGPVSIHRLGSPFLASPAPLAHSSGWSRATAPADLVFALLAVAGIAVLAVFDLYFLLVNRTHHTGLPVMSLAWCYGALALLGAGGVGWSRGGGALRPGLAWLVLVVGLGGFLDIAVLERLGVVMEYEVWLQRGMP